MILRDDKCGRCCIELAQPMLAIDRSLARFRRGDELQRRMLRDLHLGSRAGSGHRADHGFRHLPRPGDPSDRRGETGRDHRPHFRRSLRVEHRHGLVQARNGDVRARRSASTTSVTGSATSGCPSSSACGARRSRSASMASSSPSLIRPSSAWHGSSTSGSCARSRVLTWYAATPRPKPRMRYARSSPPAIARRPGTSCRFSGCRANPSQFASSAWTSRRCHHRRESYVLRARSSAFSAASSS